MVHITGEQLGQSQTSMPRTRPLRIMKSAPGLFNNIVCLIYCSFYQLTMGGSGGSSSSTGWLQFRCNLREMLAASVSSTADKYKYLDPDKQQLCFLFSPRDGNRCVLCRSDFFRTDAAGLRFNNIPSSYNAKALLAAAVAPEDRVYTPSSQSQTQSLVFPSEAISASGQEEAAVALGRAGNGWVGYVGDVNGEEQTSYILLALLKWAAAQ